jgi:predicted membrane protein
MKSIVGWFEALPLSMTTLIVTCLSAAVALLWTPIRSRGLRWTLAFVSPFLIAWCVYWTPVWMGADPSEYGAWSGLFLAVWGFPATIASILVVLAVGERSRRGTRDRR